MTARTPAFETARRSRAGAHVFPVVLLLFFVATLLCALVVGTDAFRSIYQMGADADETRVATSLVSNVVRSKDAAGSVRIESGPAGGSSLVLTESLDTGTFETRIYAQDGRLLEEYSPAGTPYNPQAASTIATTDRFEVELVEDGGRALRVTTDDGTAIIALRASGVIAGATSPRGGDA